MNKDCIQNSGKIHQIKQKNQIPDHRIFRRQKHRSAKNKPGEKKCDQLEQTAASDQDPVHRGCPDQMPDDHIIALKHHENRHQPDDGKRIIELTEPGGSENTCHIDPDRQSLDHPCRTGNQHQYGIAGIEMHQR